MTKEEGKLKCFDVAYLEQITEELLSYNVEPKTIYRGVPIDDFISLVKRMRETQKKVVGYNIFEGAEKYKELWVDALKDKIKLEQEVDEYLKKFNENI